jgi:hypothetical protein
LPCRWHRIRQRQGQIKRLNPCRAGACSSPPITRRARPGRRIG